MIKATILLAGLLALSSAAVILTDSNTDCLSKDELWGSVDGTKFYFCNPATNQSIEQACPRNTFFVKNATVSGCLPVDQVDSNCVNLEAVQPGPCEGNNLNQPQTSKDPAKFYVCPGPGATPVLLSCPAGKAFVKQGGYLGCFEWYQWREIRDCPE